MRQVILYPDETGTWVAECPSLPGCLSQGESRESALENIRDAIAEYIASLENSVSPTSSSNQGAIEM